MIKEHEHVGLTPTTKRAQKVERIAHNMVLF